MIFKKILISLGALGVLGGSGAGIYFLKNKNNSKTIQENSPPPASAGNTLEPASPSSLPRSNSEIGDTSRENPPVITSPNIQPPQSKPTDSTSVNPENPGTPDGSENPTSSDQEGLPNK